MNKLLVVLVLFVVNVALSAQVFGTAQTLSKGKLNFGILPTIIDNNGHSDLILFFQGGYGLVSGTDFGLKLGVLGDETYFGGDVEFALRKNISLAGGFHLYGDFGADFTGLYTFPLTNSARLSSGFDMDIVFANSKTVVPFWLPINLEIDLKKNLTFIFEAEIDTKLFDESYNTISGGVQFYF